MSWIRGTSSDYIDLSNDIVAAVTATSCDSVDSVAAGGTGYAVGDLITLTGGTFTIATVLEVLTLSGSAVATARIYNAGVYSVAPGDPVAQGSVTPAGGTGATFNLTYSTNGWTADRDTTWSGSEREVILHGSGGGGDTIYAGWRTFQDGGAGRYNWELHGMTGYDSGLNIQNQIGVSPGDHEDAVAAVQYGTYLTLQNSTVTWWVSVTPFRIILEVKVGSNYFPAYFGFFNRYGTSTEYPYPLMIAGSTNWFDAIHNQSEKMSTLTDPWTHANINNRGPIQLLNVAGEWESFANNSISGSARNTAGVIHSTLPCGTLPAYTSGSTPEQDKFLPLIGTDSFGNFIEQGDLNPPDGNLLPTPGTTDEYVLFPTILVKSVAGGAQQVYGEIDDVFWFSAKAATGGSDIVAEDRIIQNGQVYRCFPNCNRTGTWEFLAVKEN